MDLNILAALSDRQRFKSLYEAVPQGMVTPETTAMLAWFKAYFSVFPEAKRVDVDELTSLIRLRSTKASPEQLAVALHLAEKLRAPVSEATVHGILAQLHELDLSGRAGALLAQYNDGAEIDLSYELQMLASGVRRSISDGLKPQWADGNILDYLNADKDEGGLQWSMFPTLASSLKGLQIGDNVAVCMPTDKGKTSLMLRIAVEFQRQAKVLYPGQPLLYLVNEGTKERIITRAYQTAAKLSRAAMSEAAHAGTLETLYTNVVGSRDAIRAVDIHGKSMAQVSRIIEQHRPHTVFTDMTGRIRANSNKSGGANDIGQLEEVWNDMRELAVIQQFGHVGTVQVSAEGFNQLYPPLSALQNSKTGIQTTLDLVLMGGALTSPEMVNLRGISTPKNKLARSGKPSLNMFETWFDPEPNVWE